MASSKFRKRRNRVQQEPPPVGAAPRSDQAPRVGALAGVAAQAEPAREGQASENRGAGRRADRAADDDGAEGHGRRACTPPAEDGVQPKVVLPPLPKAAGSTDENEQGEETKGVEAEGHAGAIRCAEGARARQTSMTCASFTRLARGRARWRLCLVRLGAGVQVRVGSPARRRAHRRELRRRQPEGLVSCAYTLVTSSPFHVALGSLAPGNGFAFGAAVSERHTPNERWRITWSGDAVARFGGSYRTGGYMKIIHTPGLRRRRPRRRHERPPRPFAG